jgi:hypothetical protein
MPVSYLVYGSAGLLIITMLIYLINSGKRKK